MYYSLTFKDDTFRDVNTWDDWYLAPTARPSFQPPSFEPQTIEIPGRDGLLDVSTSLTGYPVYGDRTGSLDFLIHPDSPYTWHETLSKVSNYLHGQKRKVFLEDDPAYLYEGRFKVNDFSTGDVYSTLTIEYDLQPYKKARWSTLQEWEWDPFNFQTGVILKDYYNNLAIPSADTYTIIFNIQNVEEKYRQEAVGRMTTCPNIIVHSESNIDISFTNQELGINASVTASPGVNKIPEIVFSMQHPDNALIMAAKGSGTLSIEFYIGSL